MLNIAEKGPELPNRCVLGVVQELSGVVQELSRGVLSCPEVSRVAQSCSELLRFARKNKFGRQTIDVSSFANETRPTKANDALWLVNE